MRHLRCSFDDLMTLPADYVQVVYDEAQRERDAAQQAAIERRQAARRRR